MLHARRTGGDLFALLFEPPPQRAVHDRYHEEWQWRAQHYAHNPVFTYMFLSFEQLKVVRRVVLVVVVVVVGFLLI